jgi:transient receptor potential cation channel subfamily V protein 5
MFTSPLEAILDCMVMSVRNLDKPYVDLSLAKYAIVGKILLVVFLVIVAVILINLLIAMMAHTYNHTTELKREWLRQVNSNL